LKNKKSIDRVVDPDLEAWIDRFAMDVHGTAYEFWYEMHKGIHETLREFPA
jgi:glyceraldehyde-3-phosphate dehydrogenase (ferredoxin)